MNRMRGDTGIETAKPSNRDEDVARCSECGTPIDDTRVPKPRGWSHWRRLVPIGIVSTACVLFFLGSTKVFRSSPLIDAPMPEFVRPAISIDDLYHALENSDERAQTIRGQLQHAILQLASEESSFILECELSLPWGFHHDITLIGWPWIWVENVHTEQRDSVLDGATLDEQYTLQPYESWSFVYWHWHSIGSTCLLLVLVHSVLCPVITRHSRRSARRVALHMACAIIMVISALAALTVKPRHDLDPVYYFYPYNWSEGMPIFSLTEPDVFEYEGTMLAIESRCGIDSFLTEICSFIESHNIEYGYLRIRVLPEWNDGDILITQSALGIVEERRELRRWMNYQTGTTSVVPWPAATTAITFDNGVLSYSPSTDVPQDRMTTWRLDVPRLGGTLFVFWCIWIVLRIVCFIPAWRITRKRIKKHRCVVCGYQLGPPADVPSVQPGSVFLDQP